MTTLEFAKYTSYENSFDLLDVHPEITKSIPMIESLNLSGRATLKAIFGLDKRKDQLRKGQSTTKEQVEKELGIQALAIAAVIVSYASVTKNNLLKEQMKFTWKDLFDGPGQGLSEDADTILEQATLLKDELKPYGITPELIENYSDLLTDYRAKLGGPRRGIASSSDAGKQVKQHLKNLQVLFKEQIDPLIALLKKAHPGFYNQYKTTRMIINPARHKTNVSGTLADKRTGKPLMGGTIKAEEAKVETTTEADGSYKLLVPPGVTLQVTYIMEGYHPVTVTVKVKRGKVFIQNVELEPIA